MSGESSEVDSLARMIGRSCARARISLLALALSIVTVSGAGICSAQVSFEGDFLAGLPSGSFDTWGIAAGDFNGDGKLDIATVSLNEGTLNIFLGNGDGTFTGGFTYTFTAPTNSPISVISSDVNGDGILDLVVVSYNSLNLTGGGAVSVFFGKGDGTFQHNADYILASHPVAVVAADFKGGTTPDLAVTVNDAGTVAILVNNGDGTFQAPVSYAVSSAPYSIVAADFNGDGSPDIAVTNYCVTGANPLVCNGSYAGTVNVMLGRGDGTFQPANSFPVGAAPNGIAAAALQSGGNIDLLVTDAAFNQPTYGTLWVLLGKGDGTFQTPTGYPADVASGDGSSVVTADFNGDGKLDVVTSGLSVVEFQGNGDGTLQQAVDYYRSTPGYPYFTMTSGDFNGDGNPDIAVGFQTVFSVFLNAAGTTRQATTTTVQTTYNGCGGATVAASVASSGQVPTGTLTLQLDGQYYTPSQFGTLNSSGSASVNLSSLTVGSHTIRVVYSGDSLTQGSTGSSSLNVQPSASTALLNSSPNPSIVGQPVEFAATVTSSPEECVSGSVAFLDGTTVLGSSSLFQDGAALFSTATLAAGDHSITAQYAGTTYVAPSVSNVIVQVVNSPPDALFSPASLSFPSTQVGQSSAVQTVTLTNTGTLSLAIASISASGDFSETNNCGTSVAGGQNCTIKVTFSPTQGGARSGNIAVNDNASSAQQDVPLTGTGLGPGVTLSPVSLTFVNQAPGTTSSPQSVTVMNSGNANLTISSIQIGGAGSSDFTQTSNCGTLSGGSTCTIMVTFTPASQGTFTASIGIYDNLPASPQTIALAASTIAGPIVNLSPVSISFPNQYVGTSGLPQSVTLTNTGNAPLTITNVVAAPSDFGLVNVCASNLAAAGSCIISVFFDPTASGTRNGTLTVTDSASNSPQTVTLTGQGQDFSMSSSSSTATVSPGQAASYNLTIAGQGGFSQQVALSCTGAPAQSTCSVTPQTVSLGSGAAPTTVTVMVRTAERASGLPLGTGGPTDILRYHPMPLLLAWIVTLLLTIVAVSLRPVLRRAPVVLALMLFVSVGSALTACGGASGGGGGNTGTQPGNYTIIVTGNFTSGSTTLTHTTKLTLVVQ